MERSFLIPFSAVCITVTPGFPPNRVFGKDRIASSIWAQTCHLRLSADSRYSFIAVDYYDLLLAGLLAHLTLNFHWDAF